MFRLTDEQVAAIQRFQIQVVDSDHSASESVVMTVQEALTEEGSSRLLTMVKQAMRAPTNAVAASIWIRWYGFMLAGLLGLYSTQHIRFVGELADIGMVAEGTTMSFTVPRDAFVEDRELERSEALRQLLDRYGHPVVNGIYRFGGVSRLILWENVWGYVLWMYTQLMGEQSSREQAEEDLGFLLQDELWKPNLAHSPFKRFLNGQAPMESMQTYKRVTCCLYKELPDTNKCPYCPHAQK
ncbi:IucA/IucC family C-terminal-domain containing protein [Paenibacillus marinisediminis]